MVFAYTCLELTSPRSYLFYIVADVGPGGSSRPLAVAYRQGNFERRRVFERHTRVVRDTLRLIRLLSDPGNRAALEAECALAADWYRSEDIKGSQGRQRLEVADTRQPSFAILSDHSVADLQPELPWDDSSREFPFTSTCLLLGLLRDDGFNETRLGDVQLQPLITPFGPTNLEYGMVILDISNFDQVKYGIVAFPIQYMAEVHYRGEECGWDPIEDPQPAQEPYIVPVQDRPRVLQSIIQNLSMFDYTYNLKQKSYVLELEEKPLADTRVLDYIWPEGGQSSSKGIWASISKCELHRICQTLYKLTTLSQDLRPEKPTERGENMAGRVEQLITASEPHNAQMNRAIDNLLILTENDLNLDARTVSKFEKLGEFRSQLRSRLEETPDSLGPAEAAGHILRIAYSGETRLHWGMFKNISYEAVAAAILSDELRGATVLSLCVDSLKGDFGVLRSAASQIPSLKDLCLLQKPERENDEASARLCCQLFNVSHEDSWFRDKTLYLSCAFSAPLRRLPWLPTNIFPPVQAFPVTHILVRQRRVFRVGNEDTNHACYFLGDGLLDAKRFAVGFLSCLRSIGSDRDMLQFSCRTPTPSTHESRSLESRLVVSPIFAEAFAGRRADDEHASMEIGSWAVLLDSETYSESAQRKVPTGPATLQYAFVKARQPIQFSKFAGEDKSAIEYIEVVGGLRAFLREQAPGLEEVLVESLLREAEDIVTSRWPAKPAPDVRWVDGMEENTARALFDDMLEGLHI